MVSNKSLENDSWDRSARHPDVSDQDGNSGQVGI